MLVGILNILGSLGIFLYGMRVMSDGLQKAAGEKLQQILNWMTSNRFVAVLTGFLITALIQSSSATTVMVVSFVNAALLNLTQAIGVIMGANIGTTVTTWIVSYFGFKFKITAIALPVIGLGLPFMFAKTRRKRDFGEILIGFGLLFLGLMFLKEAVPDIQHNPEILEFLKNYTNLGFLSFLIFLIVGTVLTVVIQSSSAALAITVTMAFKGWIDYPTAAAIVLGENIGTTITAYLASMGTSVNARRAARAHLLFNIFGVIWMAIVFKYFTNFVLKIAPWDPNVQANLPLNLSLFHTLFNITNTLIFIGFINQLASVVTKLVKPSRSDKLTQKYSLKYVSTSVQDTGELNLYNAQKEIIKMADITQEMFEIFLEIFYNPNKKMGDKIDKIKQLEEYTDQMQEEISKYLVQCSYDALNESSRNNINYMLRIVHELESVADSCFKLALLTQKKYDKKIKLHPKADQEIRDYSNLIKEFIEFYKLHLDTRLEERDLELAFKLEQKINESRNKLKKAARYRLQEGANVRSELLYIDLLKNFEHIGDNALNIAQAQKNIT
ncbi:MAG: phosphate:Na+ symporter [Candidatus Cloacimonadota bacterium]|jgi:phosphate:Na+ symporter|nr:phosphate:Na+ symporter [Candidatus Cloacimonadota bacterium]